MADKKGMFLGKVGDGFAARSRRSARPPRRPPRRTKEAGEERHASGTVVAEVLPGPRPGNDA
jgi:hypothetical protein